MTWDRQPDVYWIAIGVPLDELEGTYQRGRNDLESAYRRGAQNLSGAHDQMQQYLGAPIGPAGGYPGAMGQSQGPQTAWGAYGPPTMQWENRSIHNMTDAELERYVNLALDANPRTTHADINATVTNRTVILSGRARSKQIKREAERVAWDIPDVQDVENNVEVLGRSAAPA